MVEKINLVASAEILSSLLADNIGGDTERFTQNPHGYIADNYGVDLTAAEVSVVRNTAAVHHLSLPFYDGLEEAAAQALTDEDAGDIYGGELGACIGGFALFLGGVIATGSIGALAGIILDRNARGDESIRGEDK